MWTDNRIQNLFGIELPIIQAPMAGVAFSEMVVAVSEAGGLGSLACALLTPKQIAQEVKTIRQQTSRPINLNFFCHQPPKADAQREAAWRNVLEPYFIELGLDPAVLPSSSSGRAAFDSAMCDLLAELRPDIVSFHFGLPDKTLVARVKAMDVKILSTATTVQEAQWLENEGCDAIIAQGSEAGGHRGMFLTDDVSAQIGTLSLVPQVVDSVKVPVIAAGGIADARGIAAAFALGAAAVQIGTAYMLSPEAKTNPLHRQALKSKNETVLTNVFTGRPARAIVNRMIRETGPMSKSAPDFPLAGGFSAPLRAKSETNGSTDFTPMWSGQSARLARELSAKEITKWLAASAFPTAPGQ
jgi:nitronate monooxygenase